MIVLDRLAFIIQKVEEWRDRDPELSNPEGFIKDLRKKGYYNHPINNERVWLNYYREAKKMRLTVPELVFMKISKTQVKDRRREPRREVVTVEVVPQQKLEELKQMTLRLKKDDPLRKKE